MTRIGLIPADRTVASDALQAGGVVLVFPGGIYDAHAQRCARTSLT
jgi:hypothetical protein